MGLIDKQTHGRPGRKGRKAEGGGREGLNWAKRGEGEGRLGASSSWAGRCVGGHMWAMGWAESELLLHRCQNIGSRSCFCCLKYASNCSDL